jgi:hypothetical protein
MGEYSVAASLSFTNAGVYKIVFGRIHSPETVKIYAKHIHWEFKARDMAEKGTHQI